MKETAKIIKLLCEDIINCDGGELEKMKAIKLIVVESLNRNNKRNILNEKRS